MERRFEQRFAVPGYLSQSLAATDVPMEASKGPKNKRGTVQGKFWRTWRGKCRTQTKRQRVISNSTAGTKAPESTQPCDVSL